MDERKFISVLQAEERAAVGYRSTEIAEEQEKALRYYNGEPFGNEEEGRSQVVSRDVASTIDGEMPDLLRVFVSGDSVVEFEPETPEDEDFAKQATDYANYIFFRDNDGYTITHDWAKDGLLHKIGIVKCYWDDSEKKSRETYEGLDEDSIVALAQEAEIIEATPSEDGTLSVTVMRKQPRGRVVIENVPPEEFLLGPRTRILNDADYCAHKVRKTLSDLIAMGFDKDKVMGLSSHEDGDTYDTREEERYKDENYINKEEDSLDPMMREVWMLEEYIRVDYDGDGLTEYRKVSRVNRVIFENIEVDEHPFADFGPNRMPHKVIGKSEADATMDIQKIKSTLLRQSLDNLYMSNNPRIEVPENYTGENTYDDLLTVRPAGIVRTKAEGGLKPLAVPFTAGSSFEMLEYWDGEREQRTGITRYNQGLDADSLNKTATGIDLIQQKGMGKLELKARNLANAFGNLFEKILHLIVKYQDRERVIRLRGEWVSMEPSIWNANMKVMVQVGLGTGDKSERVKARSYLLDIQQQAMQMGLAEPEHLYNNVAGLVKDMDLGEAATYFLSPKEGDQQARPPDPEVMAKQAEMQMKQQEAEAQFQMKQQEMQANLEMKQAEMQAKMQMEQQKLEMQNQQKIEQINIESQLKLEQMNIEAQLKREQMAAEAQLKREQMEMEAAVKARGQDIQISDVQPGGEVG